MLAGKHTTTGREQAEDDHMTVTGCSYALLADGTTAEIRPATPDDLDAADVRRALRRLEGRFGDRLSGVLVQAMIPGGVETIIGVVQEPVFGPLVVFGLGGIATEVLGDYAARLAPLTGTDADDLIRQIRAAPLLLGHLGQPAADLGALRGTLLRVSRLADDLPQVAELDLNPVIARPDGAFAVDARVQVTSHRAADPFLRQLRTPPGEQRPEKEGVPQ